MAMLGHNAATAQVNVDIDITLGGITILHYFSNLDVTIDATALTQMLGYGGTEVDEGTAGAITVSAFPFSGDAAMTATAPTNDPSDVDLTIQNAWAVRSITAAGTNTVEIVVTDDTLTEGGGDTITITDAQVDTAGGTQGAGTVNFDSPGLVSPQYGDVILSLDLSLATTAGTYNDGVFTLEATTP
ncbi:MAG: hypothetical protein KDG50_11070 [Chromatiales bacterium]|nr:hypothetical protein [Chromatiales bacterium]